MKGTRKYECVIREKRAVEGKKEESFLPFYFRIHALSISRTRLSRSQQEQATPIEPKQSGVVAVDRCFSVIVPHRNEVKADSVLLNKNTRSLC